MEPDWAATIAGRLNAGLLDRVNGSVHDNWIGGILPPIRSRKHDAVLDVVRQNERIIETKIGSLEQEARHSGQAWVGRVLAAAGDSDKHLLRDVAVYRAMWGVEDADSPLGRDLRRKAAGRNSIGPTSTDASTTPSPRSRPRKRNACRHTSRYRTSRTWNRRHWKPVTKG